MCPPHRLVRINQVSSEDGVLRLWLPVGTRVPQHLLCLDRCPHTFPPPHVSPDELLLCWRRGPRGCSCSKHGSGGGGAQWPSRSADGPPLLTPPLQTLRLHVLGKTEAMWPVAATLFCQDPTCSLAVFHVVLSVDGAFLSAKPPRLSPVFLQSFPFRWGLLGPGRTARKEAVSSQAEFMFLKHVFLRLNR